MATAKKKAKPARKPAPKAKASAKAKTKAKMTAKPKAASAKAVGANKTRKAAKTGKTTKPAAAPARAAGSLSTVARAAIDRKIQPLDDRVVVRVDATETKTAGGILIPGVAETRSARGRVVAVGAGHRNKKGQLRPLDVAVGDRVMFGEYGGVKIQIEGEELLILREADILGIVT